MSEDNTQRTRQIFYALRMQEIVCSMVSLASELDGRTLDEDAIRSLKAGIEISANAVRVLVRSTYKLLD